MDIFNNTTFKLLQQGLNGVWQKQQVASQNIANSDTPGYKAKTVNFKTVLSQTIDENNNKRNTVDLVTAVSSENNTNQTFTENNVDAEKEHIALADAQIQYGLLVNKVNNEFTMIKSALVR